MIRFLSSRTYRHALDLRRQVTRLLNEQRDILSPEAINAITAACAQLTIAIEQIRDKSVLETEMANLIAAAEQSLQPYPHSSFRDNIKELFVAAVLVLSISTFFVQLTKIPTGSMQPTLYGVTAEDLRNNPKAKIPNRFARIADYLWNGVIYYHVKARSDGSFAGMRIEPPKRIFPLVKKQRITFGSEPYEVWLPPDDLQKFIATGRRERFRAGDDIIKMKVVSGDHLLVDRLTYNFRRPKRGEIIVFKTRGIEKLDRDLGQDQLYIKRLVALGGERIRISNDQHLIVNGRSLDAATPPFENIYTFTKPPRPNHYFGHVNQSVANLWTYAPLAPLFADETQEFIVRPKHYLAMGDNTMNSRDSRDWGDLPQDNVIGKCWFVYWPISERFGWGYR